MRLKLRKYITTITGALVTIILSLIGQIVLQKPEITWLTFILGSTVTVTNTILEQNLLSVVSEEINHKLEIYSLLEKIEDGELYLRGKKAIEKCRLELEDLSKGVLKLKSGELYSYLIRVTQSAKSSVQTTQIISDGKLSAGKVLNFTDESPWYKHNLKLIDQGIYFERIIIVPKSMTLDNESEKLTQNLKQLLEKQSDANINIVLVWQEDLEDPELIQDFAIVDGKVVIVTGPSWPGQYSSNVHVYRGKFQCEHYISIYEAVRSKGQKISELTKLL